MFMIMSTYRAKAGEEDAIIAMHENWQPDQSMQAKVYLSWALFRKIDTPRDFIDITHFKDEESAAAMIHDLDQDAWLSRLVSLMEGAPVYTSYTCEWQTR